MRILVSTLFILSVVLAAPTASFAKKKCKRGYVWDADLGKCVEIVRGSH